MRTTTQLFSPFAADHSRYRPSSSASLALESVASFAQRKAAVTVASDRYEQEADGVADQVLRRAEEQRSAVPTAAPSPALSSTASDTGNSAQKKPAPGPVAPRATTVDPSPLRGGGSPLDWSLRSLIEPVLGVDLSSV